MILIDEKPLFDETYDLLKARLFEDLSDSLRAQFQERGGFVHLKQLKELIVGSGDTVFRVDHRGAWAGAANFNDAPFKVEMNGVITCSNIVVTGGTIDGVVLTGLGAGSEIAIQGWQHDMAWSAIDHDTVAWAAGTIILLDGTTYNIAGGDTGTMSAITYIYLDIAVSTTVLRTTDTPATAIGSGKILIAVAQNVASGNSAIFQVFGGKALGGVGKLIIAPDIAANVITGNEIYGNTLAAIFADLGAIIAGNITLDASGFIKGGQTAFNTGIGFFLGYDTDAYKFSIGNPSGNYLTWDGLVLKIIERTSKWIRLPLLWISGVWGDSGSIVTGYNYSYAVFDLDLGTAAQYASLKLVGGLEFSSGREIHISFDLQLEASAGEEAEGIAFGLASSSGRPNFAEDSPPDIADRDAACFFVDASGNLYARTMDDGVETDTQITGITLTNLNNYRIEFDSSEARFYVNGTLEATISTNLPDTTGGGVFFAIGRGGNDAEYNVANVSSVDILVEV